MGVLRWQGPAYQNGQRYFVYSTYTCLTLMFDIVFPSYVRFAHLLDLIFFWLGASQYGRSKSHNFHSSPSRKALNMRPKITTSGRPTSRTLENGAFKDIFGSRAAK